MAGSKIFISQAMTGRKESEVRHERWFYFTLAKLRWGSSNGGNDPELINQFDAPDDMPTFKGLTAEDRETKQSLWLLGRSIQMMRDADIIIMVGNPINSKGMMVEYEVLRQYNKNGNTWWFHTDKDMNEWCAKNYPNEYLGAKQIYNKYLSNITYGAEGPDVPKNWMETNVKENNTDKPLIDKNELYDIIHEYIKPELEKYENNDRSWLGGFDAGLFCWNLYSGSYASYASIGSRIIKENDKVIGFDIYNSHSFQEEYVNIKIRKDKIEFLEDSKFEDYDRDFMYKLYEKIKEKMEGENK